MKPALPSLSVDEYFSTVLLPALRVSTAGLEQCQRALSSGHDLFLLLDSEGDPLAASQPHQADGRGSREPTASSGASLPPVVLRRLRKATEGLDSARGARAWMGHFVWLLTRLEEGEPRIVARLTHGPYARVGQVLQLTPRQRELLWAVLSSSTVAEAAKLLHVSDNTVKTHLKKLYRIFDVKNRVELAVAVDRTEEGA